MLARGSLRAQKISSDLRQLVDSRIYATYFFAAMNGYRIRKIRRMMAVTQQDLAARVGVTQATVSRWESGISMPNGLAQLTLLKLESAIGSDRKRRTE